MITLAIMRGLKLRSNRKAFVMLCLIGFTLFISWSFNKDVRVMFSSIKPAISKPIIQEKSKELHNTIHKPPTCQFKNVDPFDPAIMKLVKKFPPFTCEGGRPWLVYLDGSTLKVNLTKVKEHPKAKNFSHCRFRDIIKSTKNDVEFSYGNWSKIFKDEIALSDDNIYIETECYDKAKQNISNSYVINIVYNRNALHSETHEARFIKHMKKNSPKETLNVMMVGMDGMAKANTVRTMPKTRDFILNELGAIELEMYNKVGINTCPNLIVLLSGHHEKFYETVKWNRRLPLDKIGDYFIWSEFSKAGYRTSVDFEEKVTGFHYLKEGFFQPPADYYTRGMVLAIEKNEQLKMENRFCLGDKPAVTLHNGHLINMATKFNTPGSPYFAFNFLTRLSHDDLNEMASGEHFYLDFFKTLRDHKVLNNTVVVFYSDHGERYGPIRRTYYGIIESKTPAVFIIVPDWFKSKYPDEFKRLQMNAANRLTSPFDIHATLRDILYFKSETPPVNPKPGYSLFHELIPETRTCRDAGVPVGLCNCDPLKKVDIDKRVADLLSKVIVDTMMEALGNYTKDKCHKLVTKSVKSVLKKETSSDVFHKSSPVELYEITIATSPGHGVFEAVVEYDSFKKTTKLRGAISRLDMYKGEKDCITDSRTRIFCFCK